MAKRRRTVTELTANTSNSTDPIVHSTAIAIAQQQAVSAALESETKLLAVRTSLQDRIQHRLRHKIHIAQSVGTMMEDVIKRIDGDLVTFEAELRCNKEFEEIRGLPPGTEVRSCYLLQLKVFLL